MSASEQFLHTLHEVGLCAIIRARQPGVALPIARTLVAAGVRLVEVTLPTPDVDEVLPTLAAEAPENVWIGAGTVITEADAARAQALGARFIVTPAACPAIAAASAAGLPSLGGAWTPTEVVNAHAMGASAVKIFPASSGGPAHLKALRDPLAHIPLVAVGGVGLDDLAGYRQAGAIGFGIGGPLIGDAATGGSLEELAARAAQFIEACRP